MKKKIKSDDKKYIWHPFTKLSNDYDPLVISSARDDKLIDIDGKEYFDLISSWWVNIHGHGKKEIIKAITEIAEVTRKECKSDTARITGAISTRTTLEMASLVYDGFSLLEAAEVTMYPQYDDAGGVDSERTLVKQIVQKYCQDDTPEDLFNADQEETTE